MLMGERLVNVKRIHPLRMVSVGRGFGPRPARTRFGIDDDFSGQQTALYHRRKSKKRRGGKTTRVRDEVRFFYRFAIGFGQSVDKVFLQISRGVIELIKLFENVGIVDPK